jgi:hypothetical protein
MQREEWMPPAAWRDVIGAWLCVLLFLLPIIVVS